jgi:hypothetical protein
MGASADSDQGDRLRRLARHLAVLESPAFSFGHWDRPMTSTDGAIRVGWYVFSPEAEALLADARALVEPFDWPAWASSREGQALLAHPDAVADASAADLVRLLTTFIRSERFGDGTLESAFNRGMLTAIVRRASALAGE